MHRVFTSRHHLQAALNRVPAVTTSLPKSDVLLRKLSHREAVERESTLNDNRSPTTLRDVDSYERWLRAGVMRRRVNDRVDAPAVGEVHHLLAQVLLRHVHDVVRTELLADLESIRIGGEPTDDDLIRAYILGRDD